MTSTFARAAPIIGLFDSGIGGLSVWQEVIRRLPGCPTIYLADSVHCPYGPRPVEEVRRFSLGITRFLIQSGASIIVVACNTASAAALDALRAEFDGPVVGMEPAVKPAAERTRTGHVGVLATQGTVNGQLFQNTSARYADGVRVHVQIGEGLVERVEAGEMDTQATALLLRQYLGPMIQAGVDQIALGCTHYSFLIPLIRRLLPQNVSVIDSAAAVARRVEQVLSGTPGCVGVKSSQAERHGCFFSSGRPQLLAAAVGRLAGHEPLVGQVEWNLAETVITQISRGEIDE